LESAKMRFYAEIEELKTALVAGGRAMDVVVDKA
jgi:hypothetical protein